MPARTDRASRADAMVFIAVLLGSCCELVGELAAPDGATRVVALGTFVRLRDPSRAEVAFVQ